MKDRKIRILYLITDLGKGGAERSITDLCHQLQKRVDIEFVIARLLSEPENAYKEVSASMRIVDLDYKSNKIFKKSYTPKYHELLEEFKPDIIHSNRFLAEYITIEKIDPKYVFVCHGRDNMIQLKNFTINTLFNKGLLVNFYEKLQLVIKKYNRTETHFVVNSLDTENYFKSVVPRKSVKNVRVIENGVNYDKFHYPDKRSISPKEKIQIVSVGSFLEKKNQVFVVDIALKLKEKGIPFEINLLGDGVQRLVIESKIKEHNLEDVIIVNGIVDNVEEWLKKSDIYLHVAWYEPFGLVFLEAMASGLPIVTLDGKGNRALVKDYFNGFFIESQDPQTFANRIEEMVNDSGLYEKLSENGKEFCTKYDMKIKVEEYVNFYKSLLS